MSKTKVTDKSSKKDKVASVKSGRVTKATEAPKAKSKAAAKAASAVVDKKSKKSKKAPTPEPESSDSESEEDESSDSSSDEEVPAKAAAKADSDSDSSDSDSESEEEKPKAKAAAKEDSSDSDSSDSDEEMADAKPAAKDDSSDSDSDSDSSDSDSEAEAPSKKRKAEEAAEPTIKKTKTEEAAPAAEEGIKNLFVGSLSWNVDEDWLRREFEGFGEIIGCRVISDRDTGRSKGFGYVEFSSAADAAKAQKEMMGYELDGRALNVDFSTPREKPANKTGDRANKYGDKRSPPSNTLFLGNLSFDCTNDVIQEIFAEHGNVTRVSLPTDRDTGALKGFGYVDFSSTEEAQSALDALNGQDIEGRPIRLDFAAARDDSNGGGRGGFGGGRGGGRGGRGGSFNRGGFGDFKGSKVSFD